MQLKVTFNVNKPVSLPLGHHAAIQGMIYNLLGRSSDYSDFLHDIGYRNGAHSFKLFVYSTLMGPHTINNGRIIFDSNIRLEIRSPKSEFCNILLDTLQNVSTVKLHHQQLFISECSFSKKSISTDSVNIRMLSPLTLSTTYYEEDKKKTHYISPSEPGFGEALQKNTANKYKAAYNEDLNNNISLEITSLTDEDRYVTKFNNRIYINGWNGTYKLSAAPEVLSFLYDSGLGSRNSQGFGMFEPF